MGVHMIVPCRTSHGIEGGTGLHDAVGRKGWGGGGGVEDLCHMGIHLSERGIDSVQLTV